MKRAVIFTSLLLYLLTANAQTGIFTKLWDKTYGGLNTDGVLGMKATADGGYIMGGESYSGMSGNKTQPNWDTALGTTDLWIVKLDSAGNIQWDKRFGGTDQDEFGALQQTRDGGYILFGDTYSDANGDVTQAPFGGADFWLVKINSDGIKEWDQRYGGVLDEAGEAVQQTSDGGYILGGYSNSPISGNKTEGNWDTTYRSFDYWIVKTDSLGNKQWDKRFGGTWQDFLSSLQQTKDGGYILGGVAESDSSGDKTQNNWDNSLETEDYWIVKIDSGGNKQWDLRYGGTSDDGLGNILLTADGGYLLAGGSVSDLSGNKTIEKEGLWLIKIDGAGNQQWESAYEGGAAYADIIATKDNGYMVSANSVTTLLDSDKTEPNLGRFQTWVVKIDSVGNKLWDKTIFSNGTDYEGYVAQSKNGSYAVANYSNSNIGGYKSQPAWSGNYDYWIVAFTDTGGTPVGVPMITATGAQVTVWPNPFSTDIAIAIQKDNLKQADFTITNLLGQPVYTKNESGPFSSAYTKMLDLSYLPNGIYFVQVVVDGESVVKEVVKE